MLGAYAALWEPDIAGVILEKPPLSHMDSNSPQLLNVLRVCDVSEVLGMLALKPLIMNGAVGNVRAIYEAAGASANFLNK